MSGSEVERVNAEEVAVAKVSRVAQTIQKLIAFKIYLRPSTYLPVARTLGPSEKIFVASLASVLLLCVASLVFGLMYFGKSDSPVGHETAKEHAEEAGGVEALDEEHADSGEEKVEDASVITQNAIPQSIRDRQDGQIEPGQDLIEPEIESTRSIASVMKDGLQVEGPPKYVELTDILAGARSTAQGDAVMIGEIVLVMSNFEGQTEAGEKTTELKALVSSLVADFTKEELRSFQGKSKLKAQIQQEVNHVLTKGQVKDILLTKFLLR